MKTVLFDFLFINSLIGCSGFLQTRVVVSSRPPDGVRDPQRRVVVVVDSFRSTTTARGFDGGKYGTNATIPSPDDVAADLGIRSFTRAPGWVWKAVWRGHGRVLLPLLHASDPVRPADSDQSLKVLWNKAVVSIDTSSPGYDDEWTFDLMPTLTRGLLRVVRPALPRLHHANIEIRTTYLNEIIDDEIRSNHGKNIRLVTIGGGYDPRSARLLSTLSSDVTEAWELDLPGVISSKRAMLERLEARRTRRGESFRYPQLSPVDLNDRAATEAILRQILRRPVDDDDDSSWHTIFVSEAVLIYLDDPNGLLKVCATTVRDESTGSQHTASLCFADRLANVPGGDEDAGRIELSRAGWNLAEWRPKPGLARHMGLARCDAGDPQIPHYDPPT